MNLGQTYKVRRKDEICFEGNIEELKAWLVANRITSDDEIKRNGYIVLEGEELWSLVKDRGELGFNPVHERRRLYSMRLRLMWISGLAVLSLIAAGCLFYLQVVTPAIEVHTISRRLEAESAERARRFDEQMKAMLGKAQVEVNLTRSRLEEIAKGIPKLNEEARMVAQSVTIADLTSSLEAIRADTKRVLDWYETRISKLENGQKSVSAQNKQVVDTRKNPNPRTVLDYLSVSWSYAGPGLRYIVVQNISVSDLTVTITRTYGGIRTPYKVTVPAGAVYNSGVQDSMTDSSGGLKAFDARDIVTISLSGSNSQSALTDINLEVK